MGLPSAEHNVGNLNKWTFIIYGTPARRTARRISRTMHFQNFWDSGSQNKTSGISNMHFQNLWDSDSQNNTSEISKHALSEFLGLRFAEQNVRHPKQCTFRSSGSPNRRTRHRKYQIIPASTPTITGGSLWQLGGRERPTWDWGDHFGNLEGGEAFGNSFLAREEPQLLRMFGESL